LLTDYENEYRGVEQSEDSVVAEEPLFKQGKLNRNLHHKKDLFVQAKIGKLKA